MQRFEYIEAQKFSTCRFENSDKNSIDHLFVLGGKDPSISSFAPCGKNGSSGWNCGRQAFIGIVFEMRNHCKIRVLSKLFCAGEFAVFGGTFIWLLKAFYF
ncbi:MAG: hypothetical protein ACLUKN_11285 [Bacilli bacterium]